jgi:hypothetical protein
MCPSVCFLPLSLLLTARCSFLLQLLAALSCSCYLLQLFSPAAARCSLLQLLAALSCSCSLLSLQLLLAPHSCSLPSSCSLLSPAAARCSLLQLLAALSCSCSLLSPAAARCSLCSCCWCHAAAHCLAALLSAAHFLLLILSDNFTALNAS